MECNILSKHSEFWQDAYICVPWMLYQSLPSPLRKVPFPSVSPSSLPLPEKQCSGFSLLDCSPVLECHRHAACTFSWVFFQRHVLRFIHSVACLRWPWDNTGLNCTGPRLCRVFSRNTRAIISLWLGVRGCGGQLRGWVRVTSSREREHRVSVSRGFWSQSHRHWG